VLAFKRSRPTCGLCQFAGGMAIEAPTLCVISGSGSTANWRWRIISVRPLTYAIISGGCGSSETRSARMRQLVTSLVLGRIDYCSIVLTGLPASTIAPLQRVQNAVVRRVLRLDRRSHITAALHELHWLPVKYRIQFKISMFIHQVTFRLWYRRICAEKGRWSPTNQPTNTKSPHNDVHRTLLTSSPSARRTVSDDLCAQRRLVQPSFDEHGLISDDVRSTFAVWTFGTLAHRRYAPWPHILHFVQRWRFTLITLHFSWFYCYFPLSWLLCNAQSVAAVWLRTVNVSM